LGREGSRALEGSRPHDCRPARADMYVSDRVHG